VQAHILSPAEPNLAAAASPENKQNIAHLAMLNISCATQVVCDHNHCVYHNLYYNNGRWYAIVDGARHIDSWRFSRNQVSESMNECVSE
jgi:hypothetical protein